jgi:hypothetical protein
MRWAMGLYAWAGLTTALAHGLYALPQTGGARMEALIVGAAWPLTGVAFAIKALL